MQHANKMMKVLEGNFLRREFPLKSLLDFFHARLSVEHVEDGKFLFMKAVVIQSDRFLHDPVSTTLVLVTRKVRSGRILRASGREELLIKLSASVAMDSFLPHWET